MSMQAFYSNISDSSSTIKEAEALQRVAQASLEQVQAVRNEWEWDMWREAN
ncbi:MAG: hypothetical protein KIT07_02790 [Anaerolineales bacterium]|nr:hypothetical protein [Anaerolineales bacterium]